MVLPLFCTSGEKYIFQSLDPLLVIIIKSYMLFSAHDLFSLFQLEGSGGVSRLDPRAYLLNFIPQFIITKVVF